MTYIEEFQRRVEQYFQCGQRNEPGGRIILDLMRALRECNNDRAQDQQRLFHYEGAMIEMRAENDRMRAKLKRIGELNAENLADIDAMIVERKP